MEATSAVIVAFVNLGMEDLTVRSLSGKVSSNMSMRRKLLSDSAATGVQQQSTIYIQDVSIRRSFSTGIQKIYGSKRPGYRLLIVVELQWLRYRSITSSSLTPMQQ